MRRAFPRAQCFRRYLPHKEFIEINGRGKIQCNFRQRFFKASAPESLMRHTMNPRIKCLIFSLIPIFQCTEKTVTNELRNLQTNEHRRSRMLQAIECSCSRKAGTAHKELRTNEHSFLPPVRVLNSEIRQERKRVVHWCLLRIVFTLFGKCAGIVGNVLCPENRSQRTGRRLNVM